MEAHELAEKFRNNTKTEESYQEIVKWCSENSSKLDLKDEDQQYLYEMSARYLMKIKIGNWNETDTNVIINSFAKAYANTCGIDDKLVVEVLELSEYRERFKDDSNAKHIRYSDGRSHVIYSSKVKEDLMSKEAIQFLRGLQTIFHEVVHAEQYNKLYKAEDESEFHYNGNLYKLALEVIMRKVYPKFYDENYFYLLGEYQAEYIGLAQAMNMMNVYYKKDFFPIQDTEKLKEMLR